MDCAKAMCWCGKERPPLWCIPTTAGTGSEVTSFAVLTDTDRGVKIPLVDDGLLAEAAVLDPGLLDGVPPQVTADTGMDVLTTPPRPPWPRGASPFSGALAERAFALADQRLPAAYTGDRTAKGDMLYASCMAGMAFNAAGLGVCHALAHALGGRFHLPHGRLNALLLPQVILFNAQDPRAAEGYSRLASSAAWLGIPGAGRCPDPAADPAEDRPPGSRYPPETSGRPCPALSRPPWPTPASPPTPGRSGQGTSRPCCWKSGAGHDRDTKISRHRHWNILPTGWQAARGEPDGF